MRNLSPIQVLLGATAIVFGCTIIVVSIVLATIDQFNLLFALIPSLVISSITFLVFYFFFRNFITDRLRILYRSIRKGKSYQMGKTTGMNTDLISNAEADTKKWTEERIDEISKLKEQEEFRREFLGNLAHELKTPVFSIQGYILTLLDGGLEDETVNRSFLERASKATERMTAILEDLDQITKMEVNAIQLDMVEFDIKELTSEIFEDLEMKAKRKQISLSFVKDYPITNVRADKGKISQVITNLISNSISYGRENGNTTVRFDVLDDIVSIEVSDDGLGIDEKHLPRLFERFYRVEKSRNRNEGGSGLGLAIAKHIIESHKQSIHVQSTIDVGSRFTFTLDRG